MQLAREYAAAIAQLSGYLRVEKSFDLVVKRVKCGFGEACVFFVDGMTKDGEMLRILQAIMALKTPPTAGEMEMAIPYVETELVSDLHSAARCVLSGASLIIWGGFLGVAVSCDTRTYPARPTEEPDSDRVIEGAHDGFVETLVTNTALIRRRLRDPRLTMRHFNLGGSSETDVVICYMEGLAEERMVSQISEKIQRAKPRSVTLGYQSLAESLIRRGWLNPFPKIRTTERPDTAAAELMEGRILVLCDTSPRVMLLPTSVFDYLSQTDDYYFPPLTGSYLRIVRILILLSSVVATPLWYLALQNSAVLPPGLSFLIPKEPGALPILLQLLLVELAVDGLKIASMNTPDLLSSSLSVVGALLLGDFAVQVGWLCPDVIFYMAFVGIAGFAAQNHELGYALKFVRVLTLILVAVLNYWGFVLGMAAFVFLVATNNSVIKGRYLFPLVPFNWAAFVGLFVRKRKQDFKK